MKETLSVNKLTISFAGTAANAVNGISFTIDEGSTLAIVGESGSGKSLTALALMCLLPVSAKQTDSITLTTDTKTELDKLPPGKWTEVRGDKIAMIFQEPMSALNPVMKVGRQLYESIHTHQQLSKQDAKQLAIEWLRKVQLPDPQKLYDRYPHQLSGGQKQRVMIAMAMCNNPALLIADEPTTALDVTVQKEVVELMKQLQQEHHTSMIFITHDLALAAQIADEILVMYKGEIMEQGPVQQVLEHPVHPYTKALLACRPSPDHKNKRLPVVADFLGGQETDIAKDVAYATAVSDEVLLHVRDLQVWFTEHTDWLGKPIAYYKAVNGVSFDLHKGEVLGLVGESGCGKSTLGRSLVGLLPVHEGQVIFQGKDLANMPHQEWRKVRRQIQMIFQDPYASLNPRMTIGDMLNEPLRMHHIVPPAQYRQEVQRLLAMVHLPANAANRYPHQFSGGQRQRIGIARALAMRPELLICDESVSALDVSVQAQVLNLLKELQYELKLSYLFISHDLSVVHYISDRVMVMQAGKIVEAGDAEQVLKHPTDAYTKKLIAAMP